VQDRDHPVGRAGLGSGISGLARRTDPADSAGRGARPGARCHRTSALSFNAALNFKQFWNGCADTLEAQIDLI